MMNPAEQRGDLSRGERMKAMFEAAGAQLDAPQQQPAAVQAPASNIVRNTLIAVTVVSLTAIAIAAATSYSTPETNLQNPGNYTQGMFDQLQDQTGNLFGSIFNATSTFFGTTLPGHAASLRDQTGEGFEILRNVTGTWFSSVFTGSAPHNGTFTGGFGEPNAQNESLFNLTGFNATAANATAS